MGPRNDELGTLDEKAETLVAYSYFMPAGKFILVNLQRAAYILYDAKIATSELLSNADQELYFCDGNLSKMALKISRKTKNVRYIAVY